MMTKFVAFRVFFVIIVSYLVKGTPLEVLAGQKCAKVPGCEIYEIINGRSDEDFIAFYNGIIYEYADVDESVKQRIRSSMWKKNCNKTREATDRPCSCLVYDLENGQVKPEEWCGFNNDGDYILLTLPNRDLTVKIISGAQTRVNCRNGEKELIIPQQPEQKVCKMIETVQ